MAATGKPARFEVLRPLRGSRLTVSEMSSRGITRGKRKIMEHRAYHVIHRGDPAEYSRGTQVPRDLLQDHAATRSVGYQAARRPLHIYSCGEPIAARKDYTG